MRSLQKLTAILLLLCLALSFAACGKTESPAPTETPEETAAPTAAPEPTPTPEPEETPASGSDLPAVQPPASGSDLNFNLSELELGMRVNVAVMNGPTGFGMSKLISDAARNYCLLDYAFTVESDASNVTAGLISGDIDIAALPTNAASVVYNRTDGGLVVAAEIVRGNLFLLSNGDRGISSVADLKGRTVYAPAQNPTFVLTWLCRQNGLEVGTDVIIDNTYAQPADLRTALAAGEVELAVLPEPMVTIAMSANESVRIALDLDKEWTAAGGDGIVLGCIAARAEWAQEHPNELAAFLYEYNESAAFVTAAPEAAGQLIEETGIFTNAAVAAKAIPRCSLCFVTDAEMKTEISAFLTALNEVAPQAVGGALPGEDFYYFVTK